MATLTANQRTAILSRHGSLIRTYFNRQQLDDARFAYRPRLDAVEVEFHDYLRLSSILSAGRGLPDILRRITLAPSYSQKRILVNSQGQVAGRLDINSYAKRRGQLTSPRTFPNWRVLLNHATPENALATAAACSLLSELQALSMRIPLRNTSEAALTQRIADAIAQLLTDPALGASRRMSLPDICTSESEGLFTQVAERWNTRRINNVAYRELWQWADDYRKRGLTGGGTFVGLAYSEEFDNRLFEIFCLGELREGFKQLGFREKIVRPLHERSRGPVMETEHPHSGLGISVFFQKGEGVLWTEGLPREWAQIVGVPDIGLVPRSSQLPVIIVDAKNRDRGVDSEESVSEELYKMLGYFQNFALRMHVQGRGPAGGLMFLSSSGFRDIRKYGSRSGGSLVVAALDPCEMSDGVGAKSLLEELLSDIGLFGGKPEVASAIHDLKEELRSTATDIGGEQAEEDTLDRIHELVFTQYGTPGPALSQATQGLELHLLGTIWQDMDNDVHSLLGTAEVFWAQHQLAFGMDFAPVVIELSKAMEVLLGRRLFEPFNRWARDRSLQVIKPTLTLGQMRAMIESASTASFQRQRRHEAVVLDAFLVECNVTDYVYGNLLEEVGFVNRLRRGAAHKDIVTGIEAGHLRERMLGVGTASPVFARLVASLSHL